MTVAVNDVLRATMEMNYEGQGAIQNVYTLRNEGSAISDSQALSDVIEVLEALANVLEALIAVLQVVDGVRVINLTQATDIGFGTFVDNTPFTGVGQVLPQQVAFGATLHTDRLAVVGRKYWGVPIDGIIANGSFITSGTLVAIGLAAEDMTELYVATNSSWKYGVVASFDGVFLPFTSYSLPTTTITQRRRRPGVGI